MNSCIAHLRKVGGAVIETGRSGDQTWSSLLESDTKTVGNDV